MQNINLASNDRVGSAGQEVMSQKLDWAMFEGNMTDPTTIDGLFDSTG
jgi:hypothetical protein